MSEYVDIWFKLAAQDLGWIELDVYSDDHEMTIDLKKEIQRM
jgi:hypothetical protein